VDFRLVLAPRRANGVPLEQCTVPLGVLQIKALAALAPVVEKYPALMEAKDFAIYVDGRGDVKVVQTEAWGEVRNTLFLTRPSNLVLTWRILLPSLASSQKVGRDPMLSIMEHCGAGFGI
jgi:hypothetical protein